MSFASEILMIRPAGFGFNPETASTNVFQHEGDPSGALAEFDQAVETLREVGITVHVFEDAPGPAKPDAVFPNNWVSFHPEGAVLYPVSPGRRAERRRDIIEALGFSVVLDLTHHEAEGRFLEGTGSLVLDRAYRHAFACLSERTDQMLGFRWAEAMGYKFFDFETRPVQGMPVYHSNVVGAVGSGWAVVCEEVLVDPTIIRMFDRYTIDIVRISLDQMLGFCGNILQLQGAEGPILAMSTQAHDAFSPEQREILSRHARLVHTPIPTVERIGGGSLRCMICEVR